MKYKLLFGYKKCKNNLLEYIKCMNYTNNNFIECDVLLKKFIKCSKKNYKVSLNCWN